MIRARRHRQRARLDGGAGTSSLADARKPFWIAVTFAGSVSLFAGGCGRSAQRLRLQPMSRQVMALSVADLEGTVGWYERVFGAHVLRMIVRPDGSARITLLANDHFLIELLQFRGSIRPADFVRSYKGTHQVRGVMKLGFFVRDLAAVARWLRKDGIVFVDELTESKEDGIRYLTIADPEGNEIQIFDTNVNRAHQ